MNVRETAAKAKRLAIRYLATYYYVLKPFNSQVRDDVLTSRYSKGVGPLWFFGITTAVAAFAVDKLSRYEIISIDLKPNWWQAYTDIEIFNINLKNTFVDFVNALLMALIAYAIARAFRQTTTLWKCLSAFLYVYSIIILITALIYLYGLNFGTLAEPTGITRTHYEFLGDRKIWLNTGAESFGFDGERLLLPMPSFLHSLANTSSMYFVPLVHSLFHSTGISFNYNSHWQEIIFIIFLVDFKILLAAYILRLRVAISALIVVLCSALGFYVDAAVSRFTAKHGIMLYASTRMIPSIMPQQAFKYSTTYFENFPVKTADLAFIDYRACKSARFKSNHNFVDGFSYTSDSTLHFDMTDTDCTTEPRSLLRFLLPHYEIVRVIAVAGQTVEANQRGEIKVDGSLIANAVSKEEAQFIYKRARAVVEGVVKPGETLTLDQARDRIDAPVSGERYRYEYYGTSLPHEPDHPSYIWECVDCSDASLIPEGKLVVPSGTVLGMFDNQTRPRVILFKEADILGYPFVKAKKRW